MSRVPVSETFTAVSSPSSSTLRSMASSSVPSARLTRRTPLVARDVARISLTRVRMMSPAEVTAKISSSLDTTSAPMIAPRFGSYFRVSTPWPPRPCAAYSFSGVFLP